MQLIVFVKVLNQTAKVAVARTRVLHTCVEGLVSSDVTDE